MLNENGIKAFTNYNPTSSQFGMITSKTGLARQLQLSLRFYF